MEKKLFVNVFEGVENVNGQRISRDSAYVSADDHSINNSLVVSRLCGTESEAQEVADSINLV